MAGEMWETQQALKTVPRKKLNAKKFIQAQRKQYRDRPSSQQGEKQTEEAGIRDSEEIDLDDFQRMVEEVHNSSNRSVEEYEKLMAKWIAGTLKHCERAGTKQALAEEEEIQKLNTVVEEHKAEIDRLKKAVQEQSKAAQVIEEQRTEIGRLNGVVHEQNKLIQERRKSIERCQLKKSEDENCQLKKVVEEQAAMISVLREEITKLVSGLKKRLSVS